MQTDKSNVVKLNPPEKNNKPALFSFEDLSNEKGVLEALKTVGKALKSAGAEPLKLSGNELNSVVAKALKGSRESGKRYKPLIFIFDDGQTLELRVKQTGDFYKAILAGKTLPIKNQDDHQLAIKEIANAAKGNSKKFIAAMARKAAKGDKLPKTTMSKKQQIAAMETERDTIKADIEAIDAEINRMNAEMGKAA